MNSLQVKMVCAMLMLLSGMISVRRMCFRMQFVYASLAVLSGHKDFNSLYAANDTVQERFTVNTMGAPNNSTTMVRSKQVQQTCIELIPLLQCGCDNISCPFCNIMTSMRNSQPSID